MSHPPLPSQMRRSRAVQSGERQEFHDGAISPSGKSEAPDTPFRITSLQKDSEGKNVASTPVRANQGSGKDSRSRRNSPDPGITGILGVPFFPPYRPSECRLYWRWVKIRTAGFSPDRLAPKNSEQQGNRCRFPITPLRLPAQWKVLKGVMAWLSCSDPFPP